MPPRIVTGIGLVAAGALVGGIATLATGGGVPGEPFAATAEPAVLGTSEPDLSALRVEERADGPVVVVPLLRSVGTPDVGGVLIMTTVPAGERLATPQLVADGLAACAKYTAELGIVAPRQAEWDACSSALAAAGVDLPDPTPSEVPSETP